MKVPSVDPRRRRARKVLTYAAVVLLIIFADSFYEARVIVLRGPAQAYAICSNHGYFTVQLATDLSSEKKSPWELRCDVLSTWRTEGPAYDSVWSRLGILTSPARIPWSEGRSSWE